MSDVTRLKAEVVERYPHDKGAYTVGFVYAGGLLFESTGEKGTSTLRRVSLESGEVTKSVSLEGTLTGGGLVAKGDRLVQLTQGAGRALEWERDTFALRRKLAFDGDGWGLCHDGKQFVMSDGTDVLQLRDSDSFALTGTVKVRVDPAFELRSVILAELECVDGDVFANLARYRYVLRIAMPSGEVTGLIDAREAVREEADVNPPPGSMLIEFGTLNGIAYVPERKHWLLTGQNWANVYEVELVPDSLFGSL